MPAADATFVRDELAVTIDRQSASSGSDPRTSIVSESLDRPRSAPTHDLADVVWIGGGSGAGKSTIARRLADRHGLRLYSTDDVMGDHADRCASEDCPYLDAFRRMDMDERWVSRSPETMLETFHWFRGEGFELILEDLQRFGSRERVIVEGFRLLPDRVAAQPGTRYRSVWLVPTPAFRRSAFERRGTLWAIAGRTTDPERALANLLERDRLFTERLRRDGERLGVSMIDVDGSIDEDALTSRVEALVGLA